jgi:flagellar biosynthetic protein FliQ
VALPGLGRELADQVPAALCAGIVSAMNAGELAHQVALALQLALLVAAPALCASALSGLLSGVAQSATQVQDPALAFVPRVVAVCAALFLSGGWMVAKLVAFTAALWRTL